ncbi:hypothetical protein BDC45DRAFT_500536 [Circinella umbellata]|nr:hypothetical protein BDC45DRAFT_500536 [Circinella umbellata]
MFMRLIILESDRHSLWIKIVGIFLITVRFADWPYELAFGTLQQNLMNQRIQGGATCWAQWGNGVIIMNFVADALANLFLSGMFVRRLYLHIRLSNSVMSRQNRLIEYIARKSLVCLIFTFVVNLAMNLLKVTTFLGDRSDAFTVYFQIIESTLLVEALRVDYTRVPNQAFCENCGMEIHLPLTASKSIKNSSGRNGGGRRRVGGGRHHYHPEERQSYSLPTPVETEDSIMRAVSVFEATTSQPHIRAAALRDDEKRETNSAPVIINDKRASFSSRRTSCPLSPPSPTSPTSPTQPPNAMTTDTNNVGPVPASPTGTRRPLSHHPEWSNNDYRMF